MRFLAVTLNCHVRTFGQTVWCIRPATPCLRVHVHWSDQVGDATLLIILALCRGILGFGIGGEYPLAATISAEAASIEGRGRATTSGRGSPCCALWQLCCTPRRPAQRTRG